MITDPAKEEIKKIFGPDDFSDQPEDTITYSYDATGEESEPEVVVFARSAEQVSALLKLANEHKFPVTARGAGTGFVGASVPVKRGVALVMTRMNRILDIDEENLTALVEPGVVTGVFQEEVSKRGFFYPPDPASLKVSTLGGNVAMGSGGPKAVKYGVTRDYVLGLEIVLPTGEIMKTGAETIKSVVGFDVTRLMVGSEGTLGVVTKIRLRLLPKPEAVRTMMAAFSSVEDAARGVSRIIGNKIIPRTLEFMDANSLAAVRKQMETGIPEQARALLLLETDGSPAVADTDIEKITEVLKELNPVQLKVAGNEAEAEGLWKVRRSLSQSIGAVRPTKINEDITVPRSKIPELIARLGALSERTGLPIINFGHAGDGNIHVNVMTDKKDSADYAKAQKAVDEVFEICLKLGGTLSGEHGIGFAKARYLESEVGVAGVELIKKIKAMFDPNNILNPGKITP